MAQYLTAHLKVFLLFIPQRFANDSNFYAFLGTLNVSETNLVQVLTCYCSDKQLFFLSPDVNKTKNTASDVSERLIHPVNFPVSEALSKNIT